MKYLVALASLCILAACSKHATNESTAEESNPQEKLQTCDFGSTEFNLLKRAALTDPTANKGKPPRNGGGNGGSGGGTTTPPPSTTNSGVILLDFDGHQVSGTAWNVGGVTINCTPANLSGDAVNTIIARVTNDYAPFNIMVTTDESVFNAASISRRMRVVLTETWEWFGQAGGVALLNTFTSGTNTPCFVFTSLLNYNEKRIGEAATHEAGHTFGLYHQAVYSGTTITSQYNYGQGSGETGWAPIMGCGYYQNLTTWHNGPNSNGYASYQDEVAKITSIVGTRADDYSNSTSGAAILSSSTSGFINSAADVDFFSINLSGTRTISAVPANVGAGNSGANLDLQLRVYTSQGQLMSIVNDPSILSAATTLNPGQYYVSVSTNSNQYASTYGMLDKYTISLY